MAGMRFNQLLDDLYLLLSRRDADFVGCQSRLPDIPCKRGCFILGSAISRRRFSSVRRPYLLEMMRDRNFCPRDFHKCFCWQMAGNHFPMRFALLPVKIEQISGAPDQLSTVALVAAVAFAIKGSASRYRERLLRASRCVGSWCG